MSEEKKDMCVTRWEALVAIREEGSIRYIEARDEGCTEWYVIAAVDMQTGHVFYSSLDARMDRSAQIVINGLVDQAKEAHPYSVERMETLLDRVVDFECREEESGEGMIQAEDNLVAMGFTKKEMVFFGFPEKV